MQLDVEAAGGAATATNPATLDHSLSAVREESDDGTSTHDATQRSDTDAASTQQMQENRRVALSRILLMGVLLSTALVIASLVYFNVSADEQGDFDTQFETSARQIIHMAHKNVKTIYLSIESMSILFPSAAHHSGETFPFVTVPDFEAFGESARTLSKATLIAYAPFLQSQRDLEEWNAYSMNHSNWIEEGRSLDSAIVNIQESRKNRATQGLQYKELDAEGNRINTFVYQVSPGTERMVPAMGDGPFAPLWEMTPVPNDTSAINFDLASHPGFAALLSYTHTSAVPILSEPMAMDQLFRHIEVDTSNSPVSVLVQPIFDGFAHGTEHHVVGALTAVIPWVDFFTDVLSDGQRDMLVVADSCGHNHTFLIHGAHAEFVGPGDLHDRQFSHHVIRSIFVEFDRDSTHEHCHHSLYVFPTEALRSGYITSAPLKFAAFIMGLFVGTGIMFLVYDWLVSKRQNRTEQKASTASAIVRGLFPSDVASQLFDAKGDRDDNAFKVGPGHVAGATNETMFASTIARLHPSATVLFADIAGFTAWSSIRDPHQVFTLLETIFQAFDVLAKKNGVYKVETVGDCYVAVCGVPKPRPDHAVQMVRFARAAQLMFQEVVKELEMTLGPDTGDLGMRVGIHSGPVTAGVLRGDRARFQLFGDTVNTASRMETSGKKGHVHLSEQTAAELVKHGKKDWVVSRDDIIEVKGKGKLNTYWFKHRSESFATSSVTGNSSESPESEFFEKVQPDTVTPRRILVKELKKKELNDAVDKADRIVDWNCELLLQLLEPVVARRRALGAKASNNKKDLTSIARHMGRCPIIVDEVVEIIEMPPFPHLENVEATSLDNKVVQQLRRYVAKIAFMYNDNPFHNFEHASHVAMSVNKLLARIVAPQVDDQECAIPQQDKHLHDHTYGIKSDPMTHFTVVLAALIHDVDHPGVSNAQLASEKPALGRLYENRSVAEQNSVNLAWNALLSDEYAQLRAAIFDSEEELCRFRQLLINAVIATDIFDPELSAMRKNKWGKAFAVSKQAASTSGHNVVDQNRKATIVIEHLIQASDIAHTMQHWHVYQKWNQRLFNEMLRAYRDGRSNKDPSNGWYEGELGFFDFYIIPLAKKLKDCGVFGVSSDECLTYALQNRSEWAEKGEEIVDRYRAEFEKDLHAGAHGGSVSLVGINGDETVAIKQSVQGLEAKLNVKARAGRNSAAA